MVWAVKFRSEQLGPLELSAEYTALAEAEDALTEARCAHEVVRLEWGLTRYNSWVLEPYREAT